MEDRALPLLDPLAVTAKGMEGMGGLRPERQVVGLDRSIAFLDRALLHLSGLERGTHYARWIRL